MGFPANFQTAVFCRHVAGQNMVNVLNWTLVSGTITTTNLDTLATLFFDKIKTDYATILATLNTCDGVYLKETGVGTFQSGKSSSAAVAGSLGADTMAPQVSAVVAIRAVTGLQRHLGRIFMPAATETDNDASGRPVAGYKTTLKTMVESWVSGITVTSGLESQVVRLVLRSGNPASNFDPSSILVRSQWGTRRSRSAINRPDLPFA